MLRKITISTAASLIVLALASACKQTSPGIVKSIPWYLDGQWLIADLHSHTRFSDGRLPLAEVAAKGFLSGCDVLAITDHSDLSPRIGTASREYFAALEQARIDTPGLILLGGIEWNIPPHGGEEHVSVLLPPDKAGELLGIFRHRFDDVARQKDQPPSSADQAFLWLEQRLGSQTPGVLIYNHPSRKAEKGEDVGQRLAQWTRSNGLLVAMEGAPGHQRSSTVGSYKGTVKTVDGWDPATFQVGGEWDRLLDQGKDLWAALANSDFHNETIDYLPCSYSRTHLRVPERSAAGVLAALQAGSFWADHGHLLETLAWSASTSNPPMTSFPAEVASIGDGPIDVNLSLSRGEGGASLTLAVELIGNCASGKPEVIASATLGPGQNAAHWRLPDATSGADGDSCYLRLRVRGQRDEGPTLAALSNPMRLLLD
ncbi:MAG: hypothetical protein KDH88_12735 [Chromatiales bacterium]|nr:hypothetical protein [Chromatiales bacterium]